MDHSAFPLAASGLGLTGVFAVMVAAIALSILFQLCLTWVVSRIVTPETGTFKNALRFFGRMLVLGLAIGMVVGLVVVPLIFLTGSSGPKTDTAWGLLYFFGLLAYIAVVICGTIVNTMKVYEISVLRAIGFHFVSFLLSILMGVAFNLLVPASYIIAQQAHMEKLAAKLKHSPYKKGN